MLRKLESLKPVGSGGMAEKVQHAGSAREPQTSHCRAVPKPTPLAGYLSSGTQQPLPTRFELLALETRRSPGFSPDLQGPCRECFPSPAHGGHIPALQLPEALVEPEKTRAEAALAMAALVEEGTSHACAPSLDHLA